MITQIFKTSVFIGLLWLLSGAWHHVSAAEANDFVLVGENESSAYAEMPSIALTLPDMELGQVAQFLSSLSKSKISVDASFAKSKVKVDFHDASFAEVMANLARQVRGEVFWKEGKPKSFLFKPEAIKQATKK